MSERANDSSSRDRRGTTGHARRRSRAGACAIRHAVAAVAALILGACGDGPIDGRFLDVATTTSVANSGLAEALLPSFREQTGITVRLMLAGSGRALQMLARGDVAAAISHAPELEARVLRDHSSWLYRKFMYNDFVIVGPERDPAKVRAAKSAREAFRSIAAANVCFVSRGDESGTHARERAMWDTAGALPSPERLITSGQGMAGTLRVTGAQSAYTLTDRATFTQLAPVLGLALLFEGDPALLNTYAVLVAHPNSDAAARSFVAWLTEGNGREMLAAFRVRGTVAFVPWPKGRSSTSPGDVP